MESPKIKKQVTKEYLNEVFEYKEGALFWKIHKRSVKAGQRAGTKSKAKYRLICLDGKLYLEHRLIFLLHHGYLPKIIDHINHDPEDNRIENLREASKQQNMFNSKKPITNTSGIKHVWFRKDTKKWIVEFVIDGKKQYFGQYVNKQEAAQRAVEVKKQLHGEFAYDGYEESQINFGESPDNLYRVGGCRS